MMILGYVLIFVIFIDLIKIADQTHKMLFGDEEYYESKITLQKS